MICALAISSNSQHRSRIRPTSSPRLGILRTHPGSPSIQVPDIPRQRYSSFLRLHGNGRGTISPEAFVLYRVLEEGSCPILVNAFSFTVLNSCTATRQYRFSYLGQQQVTRSLLLFCIISCATAAYDGPIASSGKDCITLSHILDLRY